MKFINSENKRKFAAAGALTLAIAAASFGTFANATDDNKFEVGIPAVGQETVQAAECVAAEASVPATACVAAETIVPAAEGIVPAAEVIVPATEMSVPAAECTASTPASEAVVIEKQ